MLKTIRSISWGWILFLFGIGSLLTGFTMNNGTKKGNTLVCFEAGCIQVQAYTNIVIGIMMILIGIYMKFVKK